MCRWCFLLVVGVAVGCGGNDQQTDQPVSGATSTNSSTGTRGVPKNEEKLLKNDGVSDAERKTALASLATVARAREWQSPQVARWEAETVGGWRKVFAEIGVGNRRFNVVFLLVNSQVIDVIDADDWLNEKESFTSTLPTVEVGGIALAEAYKDNEIAADKAYKNRTVQVKLTVIKVTKSDSGGAILLSSAIGLRVQMPVVMLSLTQSSEAAKIDPPREITIRGHCIGVRQGVPVIRRAWIVKR